MQTTCLFFACMQCRMKQDIGQCGESLTLTKKKSLALQKTERNLYSEHTIYSLASLCTSTVDHVLSPA